MTALGWVVGVVAYFLAAIAIIFAKRSTGTERQIMVIGSVGVYVVLASVGYALALGSVSEGVASALVSLIFTLPLLGIRSPR